MGIINEHEYDDAEYTEASMACVDEVSEVLNRLWKAGASLDNIANDLTAAFHNSDIPGSLSYAVSIEQQRAT